jgi:hypothetical protein
VFSSVTDISFAAGSNNISYNSINKLRFLSTSTNTTTSRIIYKIPLFVNPYGGWAYVYPGFWDFVRIRIL